MIEPSLGFERVLLAILIDSFEEVKSGRSGAGEEEVILHLPKKLAPIKVAVFPLVKKLSSKAKEVFELIKEEIYPVFYDETGSIGRRYRRQDEIGTPYCVTIDFETLKDEAVTIRDRETMKQERVKIKELTNRLKENLI